jgi:hypothetical protein
MMSASEPALPPTSVPAGAGGGSRIRVRLADLMLWVVGAGLAAAVCRDARPASWFAPALDVARLLGLATSLLGILLVVGLVRQAAMWVRLGRAQGYVPWLVAVAWRLVAVAVLVAFLIVAARLLGGELAGNTWTDPQTVRLRLLSVTITLAMTGILAGLGPGRTPDPARDRPKTMQWLSVICAGLVGVLIAASQTVITYLVLLAMDAVRNAMSGPGALGPSRPGVQGRVLSAGLESAPVLACSLALGVLVARDCRRPAVATGSRRGGCVLLAVAAAAGVGAVWLLTVTLPRLDDWLAEGIQVAIDPLNAALIAFGFGGLAVGIAARATYRPAESVPDGAAVPRASFWRLLRNLALALLLLDFVAARAIDLIIARRATDGGPVDASWSRWVGWVDAAFDWLRSVVPWRRVAPWYVYEAPEWIALVVLMMWVAWRVVVLLLAPIGPEPTPIDASLADRDSMCRFAGRWVALSVLMIAALPMLFLAGLAVLNGVFRLLG